MTWGNFAKALTMVTVACTAAACAGRGKNGASAPAGKAAGPAPLEGEDVLAEARELNSPKYAAPPTEFRAGHVKPRPLEPAILSKTEHGFAVKFAAGAPMVTPAVHRGKVIVSGGFNSRELYALTAQTGELAWAIDLDDDGPSAAACEEGICVINTESCTIFGLNAETGEMLWSWWLGDPLTSAPAIAGGRVFSSYPAGGVHGGKATHVLAAFDLKSGKILWQRWIDSDVMSAPVVEGDDVYAATFAGTVYRFDAASGEIEAARRARATSAPVVVGDDVYYTRRTDAKGAKVASEGVVKQGRELDQTSWTANEKAAPYVDGRVQRQSGYYQQSMGADSGNGFGGGAPAAANPDAAWDNVGYGNVSSMQAFQGSRVLSLQGKNVNSMGDEVVATDAGSGQVLWSHKLKGDAASAGGFLGSAPAAAGGSIFVGTLAGEVLQLDAETGKVKRAWQVGAPIRAQVVVEEGWIYAGTDDGRLIAIDTGDRKLDGWAMWGGDAAHTGKR